MPAENVATKYLNMPRVHTTNEMPHTHTLAECAKEREKGEGGRESARLKRLHTFHIQNQEPFLVAGKCQKVTTMFA